MDPDKIIRFAERFFLWGSVFLLVFFTLAVHKFHWARGPLAKEEYYRLGLYDRPVLYPTPEPFKVESVEEAAPDVLSASEEPGLTGPEAVEDETE